MTIDIVFAANAGARDGSGHLKRSIEYASSLNRKVFTPIVYGECEFRWLQDLAIQKQIRVSRQHTFSRNSILIIDSYSLEFINEVIETSGVQKIIQIADPYTPLSPISKIIWFDPGEVPVGLADRVITSGTKCFPIQTFKTRKIELGIAKNVLISVGGSKQSKILKNLISAIEKDYFEETVFHVLGENENGFNFRNRFVFYPLGNSIGRLIDVCDTAIAASGVSTWDFLSNELLLGFYKFVDNQSSNFSYLNEKRLGLPLSVDGQSFDEFAIQTLIRDVGWRSKINFRVDDLFDREWQLTFNELIKAFSLTSHY